MSELVAKSNGGEFDLADVCCILTSKIIRDPVILSGDGELNYWAWCDPPEMDSRPHASSSPASPRVHVRTSGNFQVAVVLQRISPYRPKSTS